MMLLESYLERISRILAPISNLAYAAVCVNTLGVSFSGTAIPGARLDEASARPLVQLLVSQIPSLKYVLLGFGKRESSRNLHAHPFVGELMWWEVDFANGRTVQPISPVLGAHTREQLCKPDSTED